MVECEVLKERLNKQGSDFVMLQGYLQAADVEKQALHSKISEANKENQTLQNKISLVGVESEGLQQQVADMEKHSQAMQYEVAQARAAERAIKIELEGLREKYGTAPPPDATAVEPSASSQPPQEVKDLKKEKQELQMRVEMLEKLFAPTGEAEVVPGSDRAKVAAEQLCAMHAALAVEVVRLRKEANSLRKKRVLMMGMLAKTQSMDLDGLPSQMDSVVEVT